VRRQHCRVPAVVLVSNGLSRLPAAGFFNCGLQVQGHRAVKMGHSRNILLTGFWPPTNNMLRQFSSRPRLNTQGWLGRNWRGRGFDVHAHFPVCQDADRPGPGSGDFRVLYRNTLRDFRRFTHLYRPCAIICFSRGIAGPGWELEIGARNRDCWVADGSAAGQPVPSPPDASLAANSFRWSTLPMAEIRDAIAASHLDLPVWIDYTGEVGGFLSEYLAYLGIWYQQRHARVDDEWRCVAGGHIHVGRATALAVAVEATELTLETVIAAVASRLAGPASVPY